jgi:hypothetical protein
MGEIIIGYKGKIINSVVIILYLFGAICSKCIITSEIMSGDFNETKVKIII